METSMWTDDTDDESESIQQHTTINEIREISTYWRRLIIANAYLPLGYFLLLISVPITGWLDISRPEVVIGIIGLTLLLAHLLVPYYLYRDARALAKSPISPGWTPSRKLYAFAALLPAPPVTFGVSIVYFTFRAWYWRVPNPPSLSSLLPSRFQ